MAEATYEQVVADIQRLPLTDKQRLSDQLARELVQQGNYSELERIAREQGKRPVASFEELLGPEPEEDDTDDVDEFLREVRAMRQGSFAREFDL